MRIQRQPQCKRRITVFSRPHWIGQLLDPSREPFQHRQLQRPQYLRPQLRRQRQQPSQSIRTLKRRPTRIRQIPHLSRDILFRNISRKSRPRFRRKLRLRKQSRQPSQQPMPMHRGVPVITPIKRRRQHPRRRDIGIRQQTMRNLIRILAPNAIERHPGKPPRKPHPNFPHRPPDLPAPGLTSLSQGATIHKAKLRTSHAAWTEPSVPSFHTGYWLLLPYLSRKTFF